MPEYSVWDESRCARLRRFPTRPFGQSPAQKGQNRVRSRRGRREVMGSFLIHKKPLNRRDSPGRTEGTSYESTFKYGANALSLRAASRAQEISFLSKVR